MTKKSPRSLSVCGAKIKTPLSTSGSVQRPYWPGPSYETSSRLRMAFPCPSAASTISAARAFAHRNSFASIRQNRQSNARPVKPVYLKLLPTEPDKWAPPTRRDLTSSLGLRYPPHVGTFPKDRWSGFLADICSKRAVNDALRYTLLPPIS